MAKSMQITQDLLHSWQSHIGQNQSHLNTVCLGSKHALAFITLVASVDSKSVRQDCIGWQCWLAVSKQVQQQNEEKQEM